MGRVKRILIMVFFILFYFPMIGQASTEQTLQSREDVLDFLHEAFQAQVSLSEKGRTEKEVHAILKPYFTDSYIERFKQENIVVENGLNYTYGTDFASYYIPFFQFSDQTEVEIQPSDIYVYEFFKGEYNGPITYKDHYEGIIINKSNSGDWKVSDYSYDFDPSKEIEKEEVYTLDTVLPIHPFQSILVSSLQYLKTSTSFFYKYVAIGDE